jgi:hypothetical protein
MGGIPFCFPGNALCSILMAVYLKDSKSYGVFFLLPTNWLLVQVLLPYSLMKKPASERHLTLALDGRRS